MKLVVGLGNPGKKYEHTRHNAGFVVVGQLISAKGGSASGGNNEQLTINKSKKLEAEIAAGSVNGHKVILAKPQTYMNESGRAVRAIMDYYKIKPADLIVVHDDKDLLLGEIRVQTNRGSAGHNGVQSIIDHLGAKNFTRVRVGVALPDTKSMGDTAEFVLHKFTKEEETVLKEVIEVVMGHINKMI